MLSLLLLRRWCFRQDVDLYDRNAGNRFAFILHDEFVKEVRKQLPWLRRGYIERRDRLSTVRGRIDISRSAAALAGQSAHIDCIFDEFIENTLLFRVIATALDVVASGTWVSALLQTMTRAHDEDLKTFGELPAEAALGLRRLLGYLDSLPLVMARTHSARLRRSLHGALRVHWQLAIELADDILNDRSLDAPNNGTQIGPKIWAMRMDKVWECVLEAALKKAGAEVRRQLPVNPPWVFAGQRNGDLAVGWDSKLALLDAKYASADKGISPAYVNQMYAYGRVGSMEPEWHGIRAVGLVYLSQTAVQEVVQDWVGSQERKYVSWSPLSFGAFKASFPNQELFAHGHDGKLQEFWNNWAET